jgi:hypothetical protein
MKDNRPDFSNFLAHFTSNGAPHSERTDDYDAIRSLSAKDKLIKILSLFQNP